MSLKSAEELYTNALDVTFITHSKFIKGNPSVYLMYLNEEQKPPNIRFEKYIILYTDLHMLLLIKENQHYIVFDPYPFADAYLTRFINTAFPIANAASSVIQRGESSCAFYVVAYLGMTLQQNYPHAKAIERIRKLSSLQIREYSFKVMDLSVVQ